MTRRTRLPSLGLDRLSGVYLWVAFIITFGVWTPQLFLSIATVHSIASQQAIIGMLGMAVLVPLVCGSYDLSVGATVNLSCVLAASLQVNQHLGMWAAIACALLVSVLIGAVNGFLVVVLKMNSFIATLGMATVVAAVQEIATNNTQPSPPVGKVWTDLAQLPVAGFQIVFVYLIVLVVIVWWVLEHTPVGRYLYAIGGNREAARLSGVRVGKWTWLSLIVSGSISGIAGVLYSSQNGPSLTFGAALLLPAFAAAFLGATQLYPGRFNVWGTVLAVYVLATGVQGLQFVTGVQWLSDMFNGVALLAAVGFAVARQSRGTKTRTTWRGSNKPKSAEPLSQPVPDTLSTDVPGVVVPGDHPGRTDV